MRRATHQDTPSKWLDDVTIAGSATAVQTVTVGAIRFDTVVWLKTVESMTPVSAAAKP